MPRRLDRTYTLDPKRLGRNIRARRIECGYTQEQLARHTGYKVQPRIAALEAGDYTPSIKRLIEIAYVLAKCSVDDLLFDMENDKDGGGKKAGLSRARRPRRDAKANAT